MRTKLGGQKRFSNSVPGCTRTLCGWTLACSRSTTCSFASSRRRPGTTDSTELCPKSSLKSKFISRFISSFLIGQTQPLFNYFHSFHKYSTNLTINYKSIDGVLGTWTRGSRMVGADKSTELCRRHCTSWLLQEMAKRWCQQSVCLILTIEVFVMSKL